jgi:hypothetical protein
VAVAALVVAIASALFTGAAWLQSTQAFRRSGWVLDVDSWWDIEEDRAHVEITNTGRQACVISEIRYFISSTKVPSGVPFPEMFFSDEGPADPVDPSAKIEITRSFGELPEGFVLPPTFSFEVWVWTAGRPYKSKKELWRRRGNGS